MLANADDALVEALPSECQWADVHHILADGGLHVHSVFLVAIGDDRIVGYFDIVHSIKNLNWHRNGSALVCGSECAFTRGTIGIESGVANHMAE